MHIITLTTDLGTKDNYVALVKAEILKRHNNARLIDISHDVEKFNLIQAAYIFGNSFIHFPEGSIHILGVNSSMAQSGKYLIIRYKKQIILCPDNGVFTLFYDHSPTDIFVINAERFKAKHFIVKDILARVAGELANGAIPEELGAKTDEIVQLLKFQPTSTPTSIIGRCIYIDSFGNVITNIDEEFFNKERAGRKFVINLPGLRIEKINSTYDEVSESRAVAIFNSAGCLEIAINQSRASQLLFPKNFNAHPDFNISIDFEE